jgi:hypothetical protein
VSRLSQWLCALLAIATVWLIEDMRTRKPGPPIDELVTRYNVQVLRTINDYRYLMRDEDGTIFHAIFCTNYEPQFDAGMTLNMLHYVDRGDCWDIRRPNSYTIRRDSNGMATREHFLYAEPGRGYAETGGTGSSSRPGQPSR